MMGDREVGLEPSLVCDNCGKAGSFDIMGDYLCSQCLGYKEPKDNDSIEDGFGSAWSAWCPMCGKKSMSIVRPGKVQCYYCG